MKAEAGAGAALRVVVDTNVWLSAALTQQGAPARVVRQVLENGLPVFSAATFGELEERFWRPKFDRYLSMELRRRILHDLNAAALWVDIPRELAARRFCRDADDDKFIQTALVADAPWLVTGDRDLLEAPAVPGLRILSSAAAVRLSAFIVAR